MGTTGTEAFALKDGRGNVTGYFRGQGSTPGLWVTAEYTPEGRVTQKDWTTSGTCTETGLTKCPRMGGVPFGFHSAYKSPAHGLLYFRNRWYSAEAGQWLSQDPLGEVDSANLYAFNGFDSVNFIDPFGLRKGGGAANETVVICYEPDGFTCGPKGRAAARAAEAKGELKSQQMQSGSAPGTIYGPGIEPGSQVPPANDPGRGPSSPPPREPKKPFKKPLHELRPDEIRKQIRELPPEDFDNISGEDLDGTRMNRAQRNAAREALEDVDQKPLADTFLDFADELDDKSARQGLSDIRDFAAEQLEGQLYGAAVIGVLGKVRKGSKVVEGLLRPEQKYSGSGKHGIKWKEGPVLAKEGTPQGQWGSESDLNWATEKAATLEPGQGDWFQMPQGHSSVVHKPNGTTVPASKAWIRNNGTGTWHGYPAE